MEQITQVLFKIDVQEFHLRDCKRGDGEVEGEREANSKILDKRQDKEKKD
jgi:hypothetical protein